MKKIFTLVSVLFVAASAFAQIPVTGEGDGLLGEYWYGSQDFGNPIPAIYQDSGDFANNPHLTQGGTHEFDRVDPQILFDWGSGNPFNDHQDGTDCGCGTAQHCFSVKWTGWLLAPVTGEMIFDLCQCDDAFTLAIYDVDDMEDPIFFYDDYYFTGSHAGWNWDKDFWTFPVDLEEGHYYYIEIKYYDGSWGAHIGLRWYNEDSTEPEYIPQAQLYSKNPLADGVKNVVVSAASNGVYNLQGVKVGASTKELPSGMYIVNKDGKQQKVVVK
ncbi:MAG: hypothetical protein IJ196_03080 [Prevotella sp.]|nr:hypothetical protein [Prevotella sp.]